MCWPRKINCKVLWGLLKIYKKNWWAVLIRLGCYLSPLCKTNNIYSPTKYNINFFNLDCQRRSFVMPSGNQMVGQNHSGPSLLQGLVNRGIGIDQLPVPPGTYNPTNEAGWPPEQNREHACLCPEDHSPWPPWAPSPVFSTVDAPSLSGPHHPMGQVLTFSPRTVRKLGLRDGT